ncbi:hypothetical protein DL96DRAFT_6195 [Flagelloscypha sp. PMI_526]|nr:hypothetical protein DL96DRAFT_6195 [Flagelloscypha sp. PMI_526]
MAITPESIAMFEASLMAGHFPASNRDLIQARISIEHTEDSLAKIHELINKVQTHVQHLDRFVALKRVFLTPIRRLPVELLADIMIATQHSRHFSLVRNNSRVSILPGYGIHGLTRPLEADSTPLLLSHVSRQWRRVARSCAEIWAAVALEIYQHHDEGILQRGYRLLEIHLENSGNFPLHLTLTIDRYLGLHISRMLPAHIVGLLVAEAHRWQKCDLRMSTFDFDRVFTGRETFPLLTDLKIEVYPGSVQEPVFGYAPLLKHLDIAGLQSKNAFLRTGIPLQNIEILTISLPLASILRPADFNLATLRFRAWYDEDEDGEVHALALPVNLPPNLTNLIFDVEYDDICPYFNSVVLPNHLQALEISISSDDEECWSTPQMSAFITMLTRSYPEMRCPIQRLKLVCCQVQLIELRTLLCQFKNLLELEVSLPGYDVGLSDFFLVALSLGKTLIGLPVPMLRNLRLTSDHYRFWHDDYKHAVNQFILGRQDAAFGNPLIQKMDKVEIKLGDDVSNRKCFKTEELMHGCCVIVLVNERS